MVTVKTLMNLCAGLIFGLGLFLSGLANPAKVLSFLDVAGAWDPSLALAMAAAVTVTALGYRLAFTRSKPTFEATYHLPTATSIDARLLAGAAIFGIGWGLSGYCPGPAIASLPLQNPGTYVFVATMLLGMWLGAIVPATERQSVTALPTVPSSGRTPDGTTDPTIMKVSGHGYQTAD